MASTRDILDSKGSWSVNLCIGFAFYTVDPLLDRRAQGRLTMLQDRSNRARSESGMLRPLARTAARVNAKQEQRHIQLFRVHFTNEVKHVDRPPTQAIQGSSIYF